MGPIPLVRILPRVAGTPDNRLECRVTLLPLQPMAATAPGRTDKIWRDGEIVAWEDATIHVMSHVVHYGSSVFEGIRCYETPFGLRRERIARGVIEDRHGWLTPVSEPVGAAQ